MSSTPVHKVKIGLITAAIWNNGGFYSVDMSRSYKNGEGNWQSSTSFGHADLLNVAKCADRAEIWIARHANDSK